MHGLDELRIGIHAPYLSHGGYGGRQLRHEQARERRAVPSMRIPVSIQTTEARRGERLVGRRVRIDPRVALRHHACKSREPLWKFRRACIHPARAEAVLLLSV